MTRSDYLNFLQPRAVRCIKARDFYYLVTFTAKSSACDNHKIYRSLFSVFDAAASGLQRLVRVLWVVDPRGFFLASADTRMS